jgi:hypothetical protein
VCAGMPGEELLPRGLAASFGRRVPVGAACPDRPTPLGRTDPTFIQSNFRVGALCDHDKGIHHLRRHDRDRILSPHPTGSRESYVWTGADATRPDWLWLIPSLVVPVPRESHPDALSEPYLNLSAHTAPAMVRNFGRLRASGEIALAVPPKEEHVLPRQSLYQVVQHISFS